jgi:p-aminobenzoyl-glutamate transporter AbgT
MEKIESGNNEDDGMDRLSESFGESFGNSDSATKKEQEDEELKRIIEMEEKAVQKARLFVLVAIAVCAVAVSATIYILASRKDERSFEMEVSK